MSPARLTPVLLFALAACVIQDTPEVSGTRGAALLNDSASWVAGGPSWGDGRVAWGDWDADGDLDLAVGTIGGGGVRIFVSTNGALETTPAWQSVETDQVGDLAWGDMDADGDLDLAVATFDDLSVQPAAAANLVYVNSLDGAASGCLSPPCWLEDSASWVSDEEEDSLAVQWAGWDGDEYPELTFASEYAEARIHANFGGALATSGDVASGGWSSGDTSLASHGLDWADYDGDGDPDLAVANYNGPTQVYTNLGGAMGAGGPWESAALAPTWDVAWADWDGDGTLELVEGNEGAVLQLYQYDESNGGFMTMWTSSPAASTRAIAWGDENLDGALDLAVANHLGSDSDLVYEGSGAGLVVGLWLQSEELWSSDVAWGDPDNDGDFDLAVGVGSDGGAVLYTNEGSGLSLDWSAGLTHPSEQPLAAPQAADWGDFNFDGHLDLATPQVSSIRPPYAVYLGLGDGTFPSTVLGSGTESAVDAAWGDWDDDGDLDLALAGQAGTPPRVYENHVIHPTEQGYWFTQEWEYVTTSSMEGFAIAWADWDIDGDLDLSLTRWESNGGSGLGASDLIFENTGGALASTPVWESPTQERSYEMDWGDWDCDGDLDLATAGGQGDDSWIYTNTGGGFAPSPTSFSLPALNDLDWGDMDGDGDPDLAVAQAGANNGTRVYENTGDCVLLPGLTLLWQADPMAGGDHYDDRDVAWGDWDGDGDLDLSVTTLDLTQPNRVYENLGGILDVQPAWQSWDFKGNASVWGDADQDGDLDLAIVYNDSALTMELFGNHRIAAPGLPDDPTHAVMGNPYGDLASGGAALAMRAVQGRVLIPAPDGSIEVPFTLVDDESDPAPSVRLEYSAQGGGLWELATLISGEATTDLAASPAGTDHLLLWNMAADLATRSDTLALRVVVEWQAPRQVSRSVRWGELAAAPVRVRVVPDCDADGDGYSCLETNPGWDCDDTDPAFNPGAVDTADDGEDQDCNGFDTITCFEDGDGDGIGGAATVEETEDGDCDDGIDQSSQTGDCDDAESDVYPDAPEACDSVDSDCDGSLVDDFADLDGDGLPDCADEDSDGDGDGDITDCAPFDPAVHAGAAEACDDVDSDCDGSLADDFADLDGDDLPDCVDLDMDGDGHEGDDGDGSDCDDADSEVYPGADEVADDSVDQDCNGVDAVECYEDGDGDGFGSEVTVIEYENGYCDDDDGHSDSSGDCDDDDPLVNPDAVESCNGVDDDCDGALLAGEADADGDGFLACGADCDDAEATRFPANPEVCDGLDNDCDEALPGDEVDSDGDGLVDCEDPDLGPGCTVSCASAQTPGAAGGALLLLLPLLLRRFRS
jgi:hypothetical protein